MYFLFSKAKKESTKEKVLFFPQNFASCEMVAAARVRARRVAPAI